VPERIVRRLAPEERRERIVAGARIALGEKGVTEVTVRDIATTAGVALGTVTHHFSGIGEILTEVLNSVRDETRDRVAEALAGRESALDGVDRFVDVLLADDLATRDAWSLWLGAGARAARHPQLADYFADRGTAWRAVICGLLIEGTQSGEFAVADLQAATTEILALVDGYGLQGFFGNGQPSPAEARDQARAAIRARLGGAA
jgi:AcrR family transcriptional regulator